MLRIPQISHTELWDICGIFAERFAGQGWLGSSENRLVSGQQTFDFLLRRNDQIASLA